MTMTDKEAKNLICPYISIGKETIRCVGSGCMGWKTSDRSKHYLETDESTKNCGPIKKVFTYDGKEFNMICEGFCVLIQKDAGKTDSIKKKKEDHGLGID